MIKKNQLEIIKKAALFLDWEIAFGGKSKGNRHLFRVADIAKKLAQIEGANISVCQAGAWIHDIGLIYGNNNHAINGKKIAQPFLKSLQISKETINKILHCIEAHEGEVKFKNIEAKIVHDADVLDKLGLLGLIRHSWKLININKGDKKNIDNFIKEIRVHLKWRRSRLQTKNAKKISKKFLSVSNSFFKNKKIFRRTVNKIVKLSLNNKITDEIAKELIENLPEKYASCLKYQLNADIFKLDKRGSLG